MNIFWLDQDPELCARYHADTHCSKMILETAQLLCTAVVLNGGEAPYKATHRNHPCTKWVAESADAWKETLELGLMLGVEFSKRYGKVHKSAGIMADLICNSPDIPASAKPQAMPDWCHGSDTIAAYRRYYFFHKYSMCRWSYPASKPDWFSEMESISWGPIPPDVIDESARSTRRVNRVRTRDLIREFNNAGKSNSFKAGTSS